MLDKEPTDPICMELIDLIYVLCEIRRYKQLEDPFIPHKEGENPLSINETLEYLEDFKTYFQNVDTSLADYYANENEVGFLSALLILSGLEEDIKDFIKSLDFF